MEAGDDDHRGEQLYVTFSKEYLVRGRACVRIRDRPTGRWGPVLPNRVLGSVPRDEPDAEFVCDLGVGKPRVGERLCIQVGGERVVSTPILAIEPIAGRAAPD
ncbi:MAG: hypothetical protein OXU20_16415 [Myxococcales bacterium]|nr:hypothetical protein [Myxococcales bacterium]MDD9972231.1 hypothetical protein [Myxococcales bacterium]